MECSQQKEWSNFEKQPSSDNQIYGLSQDDAVNIENSEIYAIY